MITIKFEDKDWREKLEKDLKSFGITQISRSICHFIFQYRSRIVDVNGYSFKNIPELYIKREQGITYFNVIDFKKYIEIFEEKKKERVQNKKVIEFKSIMFDAKFQAMVDEIPNLKIERISRNQKIIYIDLFLYTLNLELRFDTNLTYEKLKTIDLFEQNWSIRDGWRHLNFKKDLKLNLIFEKLKDDGLHKLGEEYLISFSKCQEANSLRLEYQQIWSCERTEQSDKDYKWYKSEHEKEVHNKDILVQNFKNYLKSIL